MKAAPLVGPQPIAPSRGGRVLRCVSEAAGNLIMASKRSKLQLLYDLAQRTFAGHSQPTPTQIDVLKLALGSVPLAELGIQHRAECACAEEDCPGRLPCDGADSADLQFNPDKATGPRPSITYLHIHEDENLSLGIFCLPANAQIPLHNHPGMTVLSRVLYGKMHVKSYDWVEGGEQAQDEGGSMQREARRVLNRVFCAADEPAVLFPSSGGNIHQFTAVTDCAVLDLLSPPYNTDDGRDCMYYREAALSEGEQRGDVVMLGEYEPPSNFVIDSGVYKGLPIRTQPYLLRSILAAAAAAKAGGQGAAQPSPSASQDTSQTQQPQSQQHSEAGGTAAAAGSGGETSSGSRHGSSSDAGAGRSAAQPPQSPLAGGGGSPSTKARRGSKKSQRRRSG